jgi:hypothetical protein
MHLTPSLPCSDSPQSDSHRLPAAEAVVVVKLKAEVGVAGDRAIRPLLNPPADVRTFPPSRLRVGGLLLVERLVFGGVGGDHVEVRVSDELVDQ